MSLAGVGKGLWNGAKGIARGPQKIAEGVGRVAGAYGTGIVNAFAKNPALAVGAVASGAAVGAALADMDGQANPGKTAMAYGTGVAAASLVPGVLPAAASVGTAAIGAAGMGVGAVSNLGGAMINKKAFPDKLSLSNISEVKFSALGKVAFGGVAAFQGIQNGVRAFQRSRMGVNDGMMRTATPTVPQFDTGSSGASYANNAGATGDLVFSMYNNR